MLQKSYLHLVATTLLHYDLIKVTIKRDLSLQPNQIKLKKKEEKRKKEKRKKKPKGKVYIIEHCIYHTHVCPVTICSFRR